MRLSRILRSSYCCTASHSMRLRKRFSPPNIEENWTLREPQIMALHKHISTTTHTTPSEPKCSPSAAQNTKLDAADVIALDESFSDSDDSIKITLSVPLKQKSPVKAHNKQFEEDFNSDFTDEDDSLVEVRSQLMKNEQSTKVSNIAKDFTSSPHVQNPSQKIKASQQSSQENKNMSFPKLQRIVSEGDFSESFDDDSLSEIKEEAQVHTKELANKPISLLRTSSSVAFTSSPSYHKTETVYKRVLAPSNSSNVDGSSKAMIEAQNDHILESFDEVSRGDPFPILSNEELKQEFMKETNNDLYPKIPPVLQSTPVSKDLYPSMDSYNEKYTIDKQSVKEEEPVRDFFKPKIPKTTSRSFTNSRIPSLLNKPKAKNAEILLMTQRPQMHQMVNDVIQVRAASTTSYNGERSAEIPVIRGKTVQPFSLSKEQNHVVELAKGGKSLFYTGSAGTGKSILLRSMIKTLRAMHPKDSVAVTASTGLAACNIGGVTLHSFAGIGLGKEKVEDLVKRIRKSKKSRDRWKNTKVLIIDEISMIDGHLFDKLEYIARIIRRNDDPFGGVQVIVCGDFFQLPPVSKADEQQAIFCFDSPSWKRCIQLTITLQKIFRQKGDMDFITMLNEMRLGKLSATSIDNFRKLERPLEEADVEPAELYCTRFEVERANKTRLDKLPTEIKTYTAYDGGILEDPEHRERLLSNFMAPQFLHLKKGCQVMMIKNLDESLVNGSLGKVIDFIDETTHLSYEKIAENNYIDDDFIETEIQKAKLEALEKKELSSQDLRNGALEDTVFDFFHDIESQDPEVQQNIERKKKLMNELHTSSKGKLLPLVKFLTPDGQSRTVLVQPEQWEVEDEHENPLVTRVQVPLILAWALSIHKSQGQTLPRVRVNLRKVFEKGQAYVALSRAVSREGLQVLFFDPKKVWAHPRVVEFYAQLKSAEDAIREAENSSSYNNRMIDLHQDEIEKFDDQDHFVDAPSPSQFEMKENYAFMTQDESRDNIITNRRGFRKREREESSYR